MAKTTVRYTLISFDGKQIAQDVNSKLGVSSHILYPESCDLVLTLEIPEADFETFKNDALQLQINHDAAKSAYDKMVGKLVADLQKQNQELDQALVGMAAEMQKDVDEKTPEKEQLRIQLEIAKKIATAISVTNVVMLKSIKTEIDLVGMEVQKKVEKKLKIFDEHKTKYHQYEAKVGADLVFGVAELVGSAVEIGLGGVTAGVASIMGIIGLVKSLITIANLIKDIHASAEQAIAEARKDLEKLKKAAKPINEEDARRRIDKLKALGKLTGTIVIKEFFGPELSATFEGTAEKLKLAKNKVYGLEVSLHALSNQIYALMALIEATLKELEAGKTIVYLDAADLKKMSKDEYKDKQKAVVKASELEGGLVKKLGTQRTDLNKLLTDISAGSEDAKKKFKEIKELRGQFKEVLAINDGTKTFEGVVSFLTKVTVITLGALNPASAAVTARAIADTLARMLVVKEAKGFIETLPAAYAKVKKALSS